MMPRGAVLLMVLLTSCALVNPPPRPVPLCTSRCGLQLYAVAGLNPSCVDFQFVEDAALMTFATESAQAASPYFADACRTFSYFTVVVEKDVLINPVTGVMNNGYTVCDIPTVRVRWMDGLVASALQHELAHAALGCRPLGPGGDHAGWPAGVQ